MALSDPRIVFGIHSISPYSRSTFVPYGILKVIGSANLALSSDIDQLFAGSNKFAWAAESKTVNSEISAKVKAYPGFMFQLFLGASVTDVGADAAGTISALTNGQGTSAFQATTGIASVSVIPSTGAANLKFGQYVFKATGAAAGTIYLLSDIDAKRGTAAVYTDDSLAVATISGITTGGNSDVATLGLRFVGGSGTIAMVSGDTFYFSVQPPSSKSTSIKIGGSTDTFPAFGALLLAARRSTGELFEIKALNVLGHGLPLSLEENAFSQPEVKAICLYDSSQDAVFLIRHMVF